MRVIITGGQLIEELAGKHELCLIDQRPVAGRTSIIADLSKRHSWTRWPHWLNAPRYPRWMEAFKNADVVLHLAIDQRPAVPEHQLLLDNIQITLNVIETAARNRISRIVFASSNWAVKALEHEMAPFCYVPDGPKIGSDAPPRPITSYGVAKAFGEISGRMAVNKGQLGSFVAVRIGSFLAFPPEDERRTRWIGVQDIRSLLRRCVEADFSGFHVVYGVSAQPTAPYDLSHTRKLLCWQPQLQL
jgi:nucleoside-diphosphate-sugar epimerase